HSEKGGNNSHTYRPGWSKSAVQYTEKFRIQADASNFEYGSSPIVCNIDKRGTQLGRCRLMLTRGGIKNSAGNPINSNYGVTDPVSDFYFPDWEGYASIDKINWIYEQRAFEENFSNFAFEYLYLKTIHEDDDKDRHCHSVFSNGQLTVAQRKALAT